MADEAKLILETQCLWFEPRRLRQMLLTVDGAGSGLDADLLDGQHGAYYLPASSYTAADVLTKLLTVDGAGSGLDADLLDGNSSAAFATSGHTHSYLPLSGGTVTGATTFNLGGSGGAFQIATPSGASGFVISNAKRMDFRWDDSKVYILASTTSSAPSTTQGITIENGGNVGIKNASPAYALDVTGSVKASGTILASDTITSTVTDAVTNAITNVLFVAHESSGTPAANFGAGISALLESSTTISRDAGRVSWKWQTATDASRASQLDLSTYYTTTERIGLSIGANSSVPLIGFLGTTPVAKPTAYTQTYSTATRTHSNITAVTPSAYAAGTNGYSTGAKASEVHAAVVAHQTDIANIKQVLNQVIDDLQAYGLLQ